MHRLRGSIIYQTAFDEDPPGPGDILQTRWGRVRVYGISNSYHGMPGHPGDGLYEIVIRPTGWRGALAYLFDDFYFWAQS